MQVITVQPITDRPIIDVVSVDDFMLIGDASDGGQVKRVLIESLPFSGGDKLAIADYSWNTIPNKPTVFAPDPHTHSIANVTGLVDAIGVKLEIADYSWGTLPSKPSTFPPDSHTHADKLEIADYSWGTIPNKPTVFTPDTHTHSIASVTGLSDSILYKLSKQNDEARSNITLANDSELSIPINGVGWIEFFLMLRVWCTSGTGGLKFSLKLPSNAEGRWGAGNSGTNSTFAGMHNTSRDVLLAANALTTQIVQITGAVYASSAGGTIDFQHAQQTASANNSIVKAGSVLRWRLS